MNHTLMIQKNTPGLRAWVSDGKTLGDDDYLPLPTIDVSEAKSSTDYIDVVSLLRQDCQQFLGGQRRKAVNLLSIMWEGEFTSFEKTMDGEKGKVVILPYLGDL